MRKTTSRKNQRKKTRGPKPALTFWLVFFAAIAVVFLLNRETIKKNFDLFMNRLSSSPGAEPLPVEDLEEVVISDPPAREPVVQPPVVTVNPEPTPTPEVTPPPPQPITPQPMPDTPKPPVQTRDRNIYFTQIDKDGQILRSRVTRKIPVSDSPMLDAINALLAGPSADEINKGLLNLIPQNTRLLSATVRGSTAYLSFSEDFMFNTFGVEGYAAQLRQIVWTVTEFQNVSDVQILVEGRRLDYLGEGIWIGSPISRQSF